MIIWANIECHLSLYTILIPVFQDIWKSRLNMMNLNFIIIDFFEVSFYIFTKKAIFASQKT